MVTRPWGFEMVLFNKKGVTFKFLHITSGKKTPSTYHKNKDIAVLAMDSNLYITCRAGTWQVDKNQIQQISPGNLQSLAAVGGDTVVAELSFSKG